MRRKRFEFIASVWHVVTGRCPFHPLLPRCLVQYCLCYSPFKRGRNDTRAYGSYDPRSKPRFLSFARTRLRKKLVYALLESVKRRRVYRNGDRLANVSDSSRFHFDSCNKVSVGCDRVIPSLTTRSSLSMLVRHAIREIVYRSSSFLRYVRTI